MRHFILIYLIGGLLLILTSCSYKQDQALFEQKTPIADSTSQKSIANIRNYKIQPQDILEITNIQNNKNIIDLAAGTNTTSTSVATSTNTLQGDNCLVEDDGTIALTGLGRIQVAGLTRVQARQRIEELYSKDLKHPLLELKIINLKVTVFGEVKTPGNLPLTKDRTTLIEVIGAAGGLTEKADEKTVKIIRGSDDKKSQVDIIDMSNIRSLSDPRTILQNGDVIYVAQNRKAIRNSNIQNFSLIAQPALLIFNTVLIILTLTRK